MSSVRHGKLPGPEDRDRNNPMAATVVVAGWGGVKGRTCLQIQGIGLEAAGSRPGDVGSRGRRPSRFQLWLDTDHCCPGSYLF